MCRILTLQQGVLQLMLGCYKSPGFFSGLGATIFRIILQPGKVNAGMVVGDRPGKSSPGEAAEAAGERFSGNI